MHPTLELVTQHFRSEYSGPKIAFFVAGGGFSALDFRRFPGGSSVYHTAIEPYSEDTANFLNKFANAGINDSSSFRFVNAEGTELALRALTAYCDNPNLLHVVINSACTSDRFRRGDNRAYIATSRGDMFLFRMSKLDEDEYSALFDKNPSYIDQVRFEEDRRIGQVALAIIMEDPSLCPALESGESIVRLHRDSNGSWTENATDSFALASN